MKINIDKKNRETIVVPVFEEKKEIKFFNQDLNLNLKKQIMKIISIYSFEGKEDESLFFNLEKQKVLLIGINKKYNFENLRKAYSLVYNIINSKKETNVLIEVPKENEEEVEAIVEGLCLTDYKFDKYISKKKEEKKKDINLFLAIDKKFLKKIKESQIICSQVKFTRNLVNENADVITPKKIENLAREFAKKNKLKIKVLDEKQIQKEKLNLIWAVGKGAVNKPRLVILEYNGNPKSKEKIALVGKGVTFDSGGLNLKPTGYIEDMKTDMGGAGTVFGAFKAAVELNLKKNLILVMGCVENAISSNSYKPGDIFVGYNGTSVEILNTDAEGRLVLADCLAYVQKKYKPTKIIDMATLTGACLVALGSNLIAMMGNDVKIKKEIFDSGEKTQDRVWELPIYDEHRELIKGEMSDLKNVGGKYGGTITAAAFLEKFVEEKTKWVHLDIAGAARARGKVPTYHPGNFATGRGVRLLVDWLKK